MTARGEGFHADHFQRLGHALNYLGLGQARTLQIEGDVFGHVHV